MIILIFIKEDYSPFQATRKMNETFEVINEINPDDLDIIPIRGIILFFRLSMICSSLYLI
jgi:hypothetical protein